MTASILVAGVTQWASSAVAAFAYNPPSIRSVTYASAPTSGGVFVNITVPCAINENSADVLRMCRVPTLALAWWFRK